MTKIIVSGPRGKMGGAILRLAVAHEGHQVLAALDAKGSKAVQGVPVYQSLQEIPEPNGAVLIEFTTPEATLQHVREAAQIGVPVVVGTTGFSSEERAELETWANQIPLLIAANTSLGVNVLLEVVERLAAVLNDYDLEIVEMHHRQKKDAPSGTALVLAEAAAKGRQVALNEVSKNGRSGLTGERPRGEIGIHAVRGGDVVGEHTLTFAGPGERIEIIHRAHSRDTFAAGALRAAAQLANRKPGLYTYNQLLDG